MKINKWTLGLAAAGVVSLGAVAEEAQNQVLTALSSTTLSGYVETSAIYNFDDGPNLGLGQSFSGADKQDGFNLQVVNLTLQKPLDEGAWSAGYRVDLMLGPDANLYGTPSSVAGASSDFAIRQAHIDLRVPVGNGLDVKAGVFDTIVGYEVFENGGNPNYSRSYAYFMEPFAHTGVLASYQVNDAIGLVGGFSENSTLSNSINSRSGAPGTKSYLAGVSLTAPEGTGLLEGASLFAGLADAGTVATPDVQHYYVGGSLPTPVDGLSLGIAWDYQTDTVATAGGTGDWWALAGYVSFQVPDSKVTLNGRAEYVEADSGGTGFAGLGTDDIFALTGTVDYALWDNVISRAEIRWDSADSNIFGGSVAGAGDKDEQLSLALNLIYQF